MDISEIRKMVKDGVLNIVENLKSLKIRNKSSFSSIKQSNVVAGGDVVGGSIFTQKVTGKNVKGTQRIWIDGVEIDSVISNEITTINIVGNVEIVDTQGSVEVEGNVIGNISTQGRVEVTGHVGGKINTQGRVSCGDVGGNVNTMGKVECGTVAGNVDTMGRVTINK